MSENVPNPSEPTPESIIVGGAAAPKPSAKSWFDSHRKVVIIVAATVVLATAAGILGWIVAKPKPDTVANTPKASGSPTPAPTPATKLSPLTGVPVDPALADRPVTGVIIENHPDARPQSGLSEAGVVYEANAEGGITRTLALFQDHRPSPIGPVRSLRPYFIDWALEFDASVAHAGGSATALNLVAPLGLRSMNGLSFASSAFYRTGDRRAPHNLYTNSDRLDQYIAKISANKPANFTPSPRKADSPNPAAPHQNVHIEYSYSGFQVDYRYDAASNDYGRLLAGVPHVDRNTGKQIRVKNIVIEMMPSTTLADGHVQMATVGKGQGWVLRDGDAIAITWVKDTHSARTKLLDAAGNDVPLNPGNTWYSIVPQGKNVSF